MTMMIGVLGRVDCKDHFAAPPLILLRYSLYKPAKFPIMSADIQLVSMAE